MSMEQFNFAEFVANTSLYRQQADLRASLVEVLRYLSLPDNEIEKFIDRETDSNLKSAIAHALALASSYRR